MKVIAWCLKNPQVWGSLSEKLMPLILGLWLVFSSTRLLQVSTSSPPWTERSWCCAAYNSQGWHWLAPQCMDMVLSSFHSWILQSRFQCNTPHGRSRSMTNKVNSFPGASLPHTTGTWYRRFAALQLCTFQPFTEAWLVLRQYILFHLFFNPDMLWRSGTSSYKCKAPEMRNRRKKKYFLQVMLEDHKNTALKSEF